MMPKPTIRFRYPSQAALEAMAVLRDRSEIYSDGFNLYECRGVARDKPEHFDFRIFRINAERLQELMDRAAIFETFDGRSDKWKPIYPPIKVARWILQDKESWPFKRLQTPEPLNYSEESS